MNQAETLIRSLAKDGRTARAIATELYGRGLKTEGGKAFSPDMVEGFLRHVGQEDAKPPAVLPKPKPCDPARHSKEADPIGEPLPKVRMLRPWPMHMDFKPDDLTVRE